MALLAVATTEAVANELAAHLRSAGFEPYVDPPRDEEEGNPLDSCWLIEVPIREHVPAVLALQPVIQSGTAYLWPTTVHYIATSAYCTYVRVVRSPDLSCTVVLKPELGRAIQTNNLNDEIMQQVRAAAIAAGVRIKTPSACIITEEWVV